MHEADKSVFYQTQYTIYLHVLLYVHVFLCLLFVLTAMGINNCLGGIPGESRSFAQCYVVQ